ncbi:MAG: aminotransferase class I/II-fold pyridoxal phosphate-dependent enzyme [Christensenellales bacterium]|jgi:aluminum resistance protein
MKINEIIANAENDLIDSFSRIDDIALYNQNKVLEAFRKNRVALMHFAPTSGYGYDDIGRDTLCRLFADVFNCESALVSPLIANGTHAISAALFGVLRPGNILYSITGNPYDTLMDVIEGDNIGSLKDFGVEFIKTELTNNGKIDTAKVIETVKEKKPDVIFIQRSRGYSWRSALSVQEISEIVTQIKKINDLPVIVDNCYGEFTDTTEPTDFGADIAVGSLIKNPGGGLAPTGGYIAGKKVFTDLIAGRLTAPGIGMEVGSYAFGYQYFYQGLFMAPHIVAQALKASALFSRVFEIMGYETLPVYGEKQNDIITSIKFNTKEELISFCQTIQTFSPVDSHVLPEPWDMPGYKHQVIMAAGAFVQGASIEMSADAPIKKPFIAYFQGSLTYEHAKIVLNRILDKI